MDFRAKSRLKNSASGLKITSLVGALPTRHQPSNGRNLKSSSPAKFDAVLVNIDKLFEARIDYFPISCELDTYAVLGTICKMFLKVCIYLKYVLKFIMMNHFAVLD